MKKLSMLLVLCATILPLGAIETYSANQVANVSAPHGFSIAQGETLTNDLIKAKSGASGEVTVTQDALNAVNRIGSAGIIVNLPIQVNGGSYNIVVAKAGSDVATNGVTAISATNIVANANFDINNAITLASVKAYNLTNGYTITDQVSVVDNGNTITFSVNGVSKQVSVFNRSGYKETAPEANGQTDPNAPQQPEAPQDAPQGEAPQLPEGVKLDANDLKVTPDVAKNLKAESDLIGMMGAKGTDVDGTPLNITATADNFAAIQKGTEGDYIITFSAETAKGETVTTTATLTVKAFALEEQQGQVAFISANNTLLKSTPLTTQVKKLEDLISVMGVKATLEAEETTPTVTADKQDDLLAGTPGTYNVTFEIKNQDPFKAAKVTVVLTVVSDETPITEDGKGYLSATNFLITTEEAKGITSTKDYIDIHSAVGNYDGHEVIISVNVEDNAKIVTGYQGIFNVVFTMDGDGDANTTKDQVKLEKKLTVVYNTNGQYVDAPEILFPDLVDTKTSRINTQFDYENYSREQRIEGKFAIVMTPQEQSKTTTIVLTPEEFTNLSYAEYLSRTQRVVIGQNGEYINEWDMDKTRNPNALTPLTRDEMDLLVQEMVGGAGLKGNNKGLSKEIFEQWQGCLKEAYAQKPNRDTPYLTYNPDIGEGGPNKILVNGQEFCTLDPYYKGTSVYLMVANPGCSHWGDDLPNKYNPPAQDMMNGMIIPQNAPAKFVGDGETIVLRNQLDDTSVANVSKLTNTSVLDNGNVVAPEAVTLNPATVPSYGPVQANYTYKDITFNNTLYVYPTNAVINPTKDGYVAGSDNMVTQAEFHNVKTADQFFALIQASSATNTKAFANPTVTCDNVADLKIGKVGAYTLTLENADKSAKTQVIFTIRPNKSIATADNKGYVDAIGSFVTEEQAKQITETKFLAGLNNASAVYNGATIAPIVEIAPESFDKIKAGTKGVYRVKYSITINGQVAEKEVNLAVAPLGSSMTADGLGFIYAQDATITSSQAQALTDPNELIKIHDAFAFYGEDEQAPIVVKTDFAAIQTSRGGDYQVTFLLDGGNNPLTREGGLQPNQAEKSVVLHVVDDITDPKPVEPTPVVAQPAPQMPTGVKNAAIGLGLVVVIAAVALVLVKRNRK